MLEPVRVVEEVVAAFNAERINVVWPHLTMDVRLLLVAHAVEGAIASGSVPATEGRVVAIDVADRGDRHPIWPHIAALISVIPLVAVSPVVTLEQVTAGVALVNVDDAVWRVEKRGGRWRVASFDTEPLDMSEARRHRTELLGNSEYLRRMLQATRN